MNKTLSSACLVVSFLLPAMVFSQTTKPNKAPKVETSKAGWTNVQDLASDIALDLRYATTNNFVKEKMYECGECYLRDEVAQALLRVHNKLKEKGYRLLMFDCYRPHSVQWRLWKKVPNPDYVADPRKGSMHNRGAAVDLSVVDKNGKALDMGSEFDFFGKEAHIDYTGHKPEVYENRKLLQNLMIAEGFKTTRTEWWHFSYTKQSYAISDFLWKCSK
jgi:zinc D-Ala-D-Ala dipeptidase